MRDWRRDADLYGPGNRKVGAVLQDFDLEPRFRERLTQICRDGLGTGRASHVRLTRYRRVKCRQTLGRHGTTEALLQRSLPPEGGGRISETPFYGRRVGLARRHRPAGFRDDEHRDGRREED